MYLAMLLFVPLLIAAVNLFLFRRKVTIEEFSLQVGVVVAIVAAGAAIAMTTSTSDTEVWSGRISNKAREKVSCSHSYPCHPHQCNCGKNGCDTCWDTCYEHSYDIDWAYYTTEDGRGTVARLDSQGLGEPSRWDAVYVGEPTASRHSYENYIKASPDSVLRRTSAPKKFVGKVPAYPAKLYDYYRLDRFVATGFVASDAREWNYLLADLNAEEGAKKQINVIFVAAKTEDPDFEFALEDAWIGGKKNDLVVIVGAPDYPKIAWLRVMTWSLSTDLKVKLRDEILNIGQMDRRDEIIKVTRDLIERYWIRRHMKDFKWLLASYQPSTDVTILLFLLGTGLCVGACFIVDENDENPDKDGL